MNAREELAIILHVLEHLTADDAVVGCGRIPGGDVGVEDIQVCKATLSRVALNDALLLRAVGNGVHNAIGEGAGAVEGKAAPATAEVEDGLAIADEGALHDEVEHAVLGLMQWRGSVWEVAAAVFAVWPKNKLEEGRVDLIMLCVNVNRCLSNRAAVGVGDEVHKRGLLLLQRSCSHSAPAFPQHHADAEAYERVGHETTLCQIHPGVQRHMQHRTEHLRRHGALRATSNRANRFLLRNRLPHLASELQLHARSCALRLLVHQVHCMGGRFSWQRIAAEHVHGERCVNVCKEPSETRRRKQD